MIEIYVQRNCNALGITRDNYKKNEYKIINYYKKCEKLKSHLQLEL